MSLLDPVSTRDREIRVWCGAGGVLHRHVFRWSTHADLRMLIQAVGAAAVVGTLEPAATFIEFVRKATEWQRSNPSKD